MSGEKEIKRYIRGREQYGDLENVTPCYRNLQLLKW